MPVQANLRYPASLAAALRGADAVVNLVGILTESGRQNFEAVHAFGARAVAAGRARRPASRRFVHVSAIGADPEVGSAYARTKARAEAAVREVFPDAVILRPSILFGPEDDFFNRFAAMARMSPALPLIGGGHTRFQPAYVGDVAEAVAMAAAGEAAAGAPYELGGPEVKTFREIARLYLRRHGAQAAAAADPVRRCARGPAAADRTGRRAAARRSSRRCW